MAGSNLPRRTLSFLFTDIEGSTLLARSLPASFATLLRRHHEILRQAFAVGREVDTAGDGFFVVFDHPSEAVAAAVQGQRLLDAERWPADGRVRVRMGVHNGPCETVGELVVGADVHLAARVCAAAHGGQVLVTREAAAVRDDLERAIGFRSLGDYLLKDFDEPLELFQVQATGLQEAFPPPRTAEARIVSLPHEPTSFVGRSRERELLDQIVARHRVVTLTGIGGSGKTRLAINAAWDIAPRFHGPVVFVPLATVEHPDQAVGLIADALGAGGAVQSWSDLVSVIRSQQALVVWDNAEHLIGTGIGERIVALRDHCDRLHALVTSRVPLAVPGEQLFPVEPLDPAAACQLLIDRARQSQPTFQAERFSDALSAIADRLDGLPLALELAAARLRSLPPASMLARLDHQLDLLKTLPADPTEERHATLRTALSWSVDLLDEEDTVVFLALSVFGSPARLDAITAVAGRSEEHTLDALARLIDVSLVRAVDSADEPRYGMLEPVRQFAEERLADRGLQADVRMRMVMWYAELAARYARLPEPFVRGFRGDQRNVLRAFGYAADEGEWDTVIDLASATSQGIFAVGGQTELLRPWVTRARVSYDQLSLRAQAQLAELQAMLDPSLEAALAAEQLARAAKDDQVLIAALDDVYEAAMDTQDYATAERAIDALATLEATYAEVKVDVCLFRARLDQRRGDAAGAQRWWQEAERVARARGDAVDLVRTLWFAGANELANGHPTRALMLTDEALAQDTTWESWAASELALRRQAAIAALLADEPGRCADHLQRALVIWSRVGISNPLSDTPVTLLTASALLAVTGYSLHAATLLNYITRDLNLKNDPEDAVSAQFALARAASASLSSDDQQRAMTDADTLTAESALQAALDAIATLLTKSVSK